MSSDSLTGLGLGAGLPAAISVNQYNVSLISILLILTGTRGRIVPAQPMNRPQFSRHSTAAFRTALHTLPAIAGY